MSDLMKEDLYEVLSIGYDSTDQEIKSAYRRLALGCHPDKNPDNPNAVQLFHRLSKALEILLDPTAKAAYDRVLKARKANVVRHKKLDQKRQKFKDDLEAKERAAKEDVFSETEAMNVLQREVERLRKEGSKQLETENQILRQEIEAEMRLKFELKLNESKSLPKFKLTKKSKAFEFNDKNLRQYLSAFGEVVALVVNKNNKKALIEFKDYKQSLNVYQNRHRFEDLFTIEWVGDNHPEDKPKETERHFANSFSSNETIDSNLGQNHSFSSDYESLVLLNLRRAAERKQLIEEMQENDD